MWFLLLALGARAACPDDPTAQVRSDAASMEVAFSQLDDAGFDRARKGFDQALPCVRGLLDSSDVAAIHRAEALALFVDGEMRSSTKAWGAVKRLTPGWEPPPALAPPGHLLRELFDEATPDGERVTLDLRPKGGWIVDGQPDDTVPVKQGFVLQALDGEGHVYYTGYELSIAEIPIVDLVQPGPSPKARKARKIGSAVAGGLAGAALVGLGVYVDAQARLKHADYDQVDALGTQAEVGAISSIGLGGAAITSFVVAWAVPW